MLGDGSHESPIPAVRCSFDCSSVEWSFALQQATLTEELARPYELDLLLRPREQGCRHDELIGRSCEFRFDRASVLRTIYGVVHSVEATVNSPYIHVRVVPALSMLAQRINSRIFQDMTVIQILRDVLMGDSSGEGGSPEGLAAYSRTIDTDGLNETEYGPPLDYCVQYCESDLDFTARLLEDAGISYYFDHERTDHEVIVLVDSNAAYRELETLRGTRELVHYEGAGMTPQETLLDFAWERTQRPDRALVRHHDWLSPQEGAEFFGEREQSETERPITVYRHSAERSREVYDADDLQRVNAEGERLAQLEHEHLRSGDIVGRGSSNATGLSPGRIVGCDGDVEEILVVSVRHRFANGDNEGGTGTRYDNQLVAIPNDCVFRPPRTTARPTISGPQTAIVTGPPGEEIYTDAYGRIKVLMHWDRDGEGGLRRDRRHDPTSSVWVRVAQMWAGPGWGTFFLPRVGMEVIVLFLDGNPDRPMVAGCVYNGENATPYGLPEDRTKSTIKSSSTLGGEGFNEFRFDDAAGREEIFIHGQRDFNTTIRRRHTMEVGENQDYNVHGDRERRVGGTETVTIEGNQSITVQGAEGGQVKGIAIDVTDDYQLNARKEARVEAPQKIELKCGDTLIELTPHKITLRAGDGAQIVLDANLLGKSKDGSELLLDANANLEASTGGSLALEGSATLECSEQARVHLDETATIESSEGAIATFDANARMEGGECRVQSGDSGLTITGDNANLESSTVGVRGESSTEIEGGGGRASFSGGQASVN